MIIARKRGAAPGAGEIGMEMHQAHREKGLRAACRVFAIFRPMGRIGLDVRVNSVPFLLIADDMIIEAALPQPPFK